MCVYASAAVTLERWLLGSLIDRARVGDVNVSTDTPLHSHSPADHDARRGQRHPVLCRRAAAMVEWAPLSVPLQRRLQTAAVLWVLTLMPTFNCIMLAMFFLPALREFYSREILLAFLAWTYVVDRKTPLNGGRYVPWVPKLAVFRYLKNYFPAKLHVQGKIDPAKQYVCGIHPHGIIGVGTTTNLIIETEENGPRKLLGGLDYRILTVTANFAVPLWRDLLMALGFVSASRESADALLNQGKSMMVVVGGALEALDARPGLVDLTLDRRKGFVKMALRHGAALVPIFCFGENEAWDQVPNPPGSLLRRIQMGAVKYFGFSLPLPLGRGVFQYTFGLMPHRREINTVIGHPIEVPKIENPTDADLDKYHALYIKGLQKLFDDNKDQFHHPVDAHGKPVESKGLRIVG